jgi:hypothetical protein
MLGVVYFYAKGSDRKLRLFSGGCCRRLWPFLDDEKGRLALEDSDRCADGIISPNELYQSWGTINEDTELHHRVSERTGFAHGLVQVAYWTIARLTNLRDMAETASTILSVMHIIGAETLGKRAGDYFAYANGEPVQIEEQEFVVAEEAMAVELARQAAMLRDLFGNPFRPEKLDSSWLTSTVLALANGIYTDRAFDRMPILAKALQDAGCENQVILDHCRQPGEHYRGCWVLDLLLSRQ